ncbi:MAD2 [Mytilus edulis]|uniref:MAD2 n=1 Tax=Mytilus edulis TaxID=6550 RepID=A0A8S3S933_MYTED|nr:MAD2 [Mytilus edulis]
MAATATQNAITLKGSTEIVSEFFSFGINSILYQRGIYPPETFTDNKIISQVKEWLQQMTVKKLVVVIKDIDTKEVFERWQFDVECDKSVLSDGKPREKSEKEINKEICSVLRQITASVTFLPLLESACAFDLLVYTDKDLEVPDSWGEDGPQFIANSEEVRLRSFTTLLHKVDAMLSTFKRKTLPTTEVVSTKQVMSSVSSNPVPCGPCKQEKVNTKAYIWCYNCNEGLCSTCSGHHKKFGSTRDHKTIDIQTYKSYKPSIGAIKTKCDPHDQQFNLFCPSHLMPCCDECISNLHTKCTGIKSLTSVVEKTKIEQSKASVEKDIKSILLFLNTTAVNRTSNIQKGEQQYKRIKESVGKIRKEINKHLDLLEKKLCKDADTVWSEEKAKLSGFITEIEEKKKTLMEIQGDLHTVNVHSSKLQSFLWMHQIEQTVHQCQRYVEDMETVNYEISSDVDIKIEQNEQIEKILSQLKSLKSFGEVKVVKSHITMNRETSVRREAQVELQGQPNIHNMTMNIEKRLRST